MGRQPPPLPRTREADQASVSSVTVVMMTGQRRASQVVRKVAHAIVLPEDDAESEGVLEQQPRDEY